MSNGIDVNEFQQKKQIEEMKRAILSRILTKDAFERLARVRLSNPQLASQAELYILQIYQSGKIQGQITDEKLREVLKLLSEKKDINIKRK